MPSGPTGMTYSSLLQNLRDYTEAGSTSNASFTRTAPQLINNAERSLADRLKIQGYRDVMTGTLAQQNNVLAKPEGWRNTVTFTIGTGASLNYRRILRMRSYEYIRALAPNDQIYGEPQWYCDYDYNHWLLAPTPAEAYPFEIIVYRLPDLLSESNQTNYLTQYVPNMLLFQCLVNMEPFLRNDPRIATWKLLLEEEFKAVNAQEIAKIVDRAQTRSSA
jgi:hypothetical protein